jgi:hypothetical protein
VSEHSQLACVGEVAHHRGHKGRTSAAESEAWQALGSFSLHISPTLRKTTLYARQIVMLRFASLTLRCCLRLLAIFFLGLSHMFSVARASSTTLRQRLLLDHQRTRSVLSSSPFGRSRPFPKHLPHRRMVLRLKRRRGTRWRPFSRDQPLAPRHLTAQQRMKASKRSHHFFWLTTILVSCVSSTYAPACHSVDFVLVLTRYYRVSLAPLRLGINSKEQQRGNPD